MQPCEHIKLELFARAIITLDFYMHLFSETYCVHGPVYDSFDKNPCDCSHCKEPALSKAERILAFKKNLIVDPASG